MRIVETEDGEGGGSEERGEKRGEHPLCVGEPGGEAPTHAAVDRDGEEQERRERHRPATRRRGEERRQSRPEKYSWIGLRSAASPVERGWEVMVRRKSLSVSWARVSSTLRSQRERSASLRDAAKVCGCRRRASKQISSIDLPSKCS